jgi:hypothetical protein
LFRECGGQTSLDREVEENRKGKRVVTKINYQSSEERG